MSKTVYTIRKYDGDSQESWAVFRSTDLKGVQRGVVFYGQARPLYTGMSKREATWRRDELEQKHANNRLTA